VAKPAAGADRHGVRRLDVALQFCVLRRLTLSQGRAFAAVDQVGVRRCREPTSRSTPPTLGRRRQAAARRLAVCLLRCLTPFQGHAFPPRDPIGTVRRCRKPTSSSTANTLGRRCQAAALQGSPAASSGSKPRRETIPAQLVVKASARLGSTPHASNARMAFFHQPAAETSPTPRGRPRPSGDRSAQDAH